MLAPGWNGVGLTVAINQAQWDEGRACGKCVRAVGTGEGIGTAAFGGPYNGTIDNLCPECKFGDVDFGMRGDGRWKITWEFVPCAEARGGGRALRADVAEDQPVDLSHLAVDEAHRHLQEACGSGSCIAGTHCAYMPGEHQRPYCAHN